MINVKDQFVMSISIDTKKDFVSVSDLSEFSITEYAGGLLPTYDLMFVTEDESVLSMLHEGKTISIQYGKDTNSLEDAILFPGDIKTVKEGNNKRYIEVSGYAVSLAYVTNPYSKISDQMSAVELMIATAKIDFKRVVTNIEKSKDKQNWIQPGINNRAFLSHLMMRANIMPSFITTAILANGTYVIKDLIKDIKENKPVWRFVRGKTTENFIDYNADATASSHNLYFNNWTGYEKEKIVLNFSTGKVEKVSTAFKPLIAMAKEIDKDPKVKGRFNGFEIQNEFVHESFWAAYDHNLVNLTQLSKIEVATSFMDQYRKIAPLDLVSYVETDTTDKGSSSEYTSGLYYVTRVTKSVQEKRYITTVSLNRESINAVRND